MVDNCSKYYTISLTKVDVDGDFLQFSSNMVDSTGSPRIPAMLDTGTTATLLPDSIYKPIMEKVKSFTIPN